MARNLIKAHDKMKGLEWTPTYFMPEAKYETKFHIPKKTKDPFRHLIRDYMAMEAEKLLAGTKWLPVSLRPAAVAVAEAAE